jgi:hypothetical protein
LYCVMNSSRPFGLWSCADSACFMFLCMLDLVGCRSLDDERLGAVNCGFVVAASLTLDRVLRAGGWNWTVSDNLSLLVLLMWQRWTR